MNKEEFKAKVEQLFAVPVPNGKGHRYELSILDFHGMYRGKNKGFGCDFKQSNYFISDFPEYHDKHIVSNEYVIFFVEGMWHIANGYEDCFSAEDYRTLEELMYDHYGISINDKNCKFCNGEACGCACTNLT